MNEDSVIKSKRLVPCITKEEMELSYKGKDDFVVYCAKPANFTKMIKCEDDDKNDIQFEVLDLEIKILVGSIKPVTIYYEVSNSSILDQLKEICKC